MILLGSYFITFEDWPSSRGVLLRVESYLCKYFELICIFQTGLKRLWKSVIPYFRSSNTKSKWQSLKSQAFFDIFLHKALVDILQKFFLCFILCQSREHIFWTKATFEEGRHELIKKGKLLAVMMVLQNGLNLFSEEGRLYFPIFSQLHDDTFHKGLIIAQKLDIFWQEKG